MTNRTSNRRRPHLGALPAVAAGLLLATGTASAAGTLDILTWEGYADESFVEPFEQQTGCNVNSTYVGSNDEFVAKVLGGGAVYDLVSPSNDTTMRLIDAGAVEPIDRARMSNMDQFFEEFQRPGWLMKDGKLYGVPYGWGIQRIIVNGDKVPSPKQSLSILWDGRFRDQISIWDDLEAIYMTARYLGFEDSYNLTDEQLQQVKEKLIELKPNIRKFWRTTGEMGNLMSSGEVVAGNSWESTIVKLRDQGMNIIDLRPKEGRGGWADSWMIVEGAGDNACVYQWLNYNSTAKAQALAHEVTGFGYSNRNLVDHLSGEARKQYKGLGMDDPDSLKRVDWWQPVKRRAKYLEIWNQVKAASVD